MRTGGDANVFEHQFGSDRRAHRELAVNVAGAESRRATLDQKPGYTLLDASPYNRDVGDRAVGDPSLGPVEDPSFAVAVAPRPGFHPARIGAVIGFGQSEASDELPFRHLGQKAALLFLGTEGVDGVHRERALD